MTQREREPAAVTENLLAQWFGFVQRLVESPQKSDRERELREREESQQQ